MLAAAGARVAPAGPHGVTVWPADAARARRRSRCPATSRRAAPFIVAATLLAGSELTVHGVGLNPTRTGLLDVLERMGARLDVFNRRRLGGEPVGDLEVRSAELVATEVDAGEVPLLVDELPLFALAAGMRARRRAWSGAPPSCA